MLKTSVVLKFREKLQLSVTVVVCLLFLDIPKVVLDVPNKCEPTSEVFLGL